MFRRYYNVAKKFFGMKIVPMRRFWIMAFMNVVREGLELVFPFLAAEIVNLVTKDDFQGAATFASLFLIHSIIFTLVCRLTAVSYTRFSIKLRENLRYQYLKRVSRYDEGYTDEIPHAFIVSSSFADIASTAVFGEHIIFVTINLLSILVDLIILSLVDLPIGLCITVLVFVALATLSHC